MKTKLKTLLQLLLRSPRRFPVEAALGVVFFVIAVLNTEKAEWHDLTARIGSVVNSDILWLFVPLMALTFWLHRANRWAYLASFFLFLPLMALNLKPFLWTYGFGFTYVLSAILLIVGNRRMDNRSFAAHALHVITQMFFGLLITGILNLAVMAIVVSFLYIFGIDAPNHLYEHILQFIWFVLAPQICCTLIRQDEDEVSEPAKVLRLILNFILTPAVIIYAVILYTYFIKIVFEWDLPRGGVAWLVMGFITVSLVGRMAQFILGQRYYDWFYRYFTLIAIPPLIMYWIGSIYRIRLYSFTESRFYLMVAGALMTLFVLMLLRERTRKFQLMALIFGTAIILFTYIPGISAKSIGLCCQKQRLEKIIHDINLIDVKTGKLKDDIDLRGIKQDSVMCERYRDACSVISYVRKGMGAKEFIKQYGEWTHSEYTFSYSNFNNPTNGVNYWYDRTKPVNLGDYDIMQSMSKYECSFDGQTFIVKLNDGSDVIQYPINSIIRQDTMLLHHPDQLMSYRNDSLMLVLERIYIEDSIVTDINSFDCQLFQRHKD